MDNVADEKEENKSTGISQYELDTKVALAKVSTRLDQLETLQERQFKKIDNLVDSMKTMVKEITSTHHENISQAYVTKDVFYQREETLKEEFDKDLNGVTVKFETSNEKQNEQINKLKLRVAQISTGVVIAWVGIYMICY